MKRVLLLLLSLSLSASISGAQEPAPIQVPRGSPPVIKYGKWGLLAASIAMNLLARDAHDRADEAFKVVSDICSLDRDRCTTLPDGRYADPALEAAYQESLDYDSRARGWLVGGESALVISAVGFIWELTRAKTKPRNIPFEPEVSERNGVTQLGLRFEF